MLRSVVAMSRIGLNIRKVEKEDALFGTINSWLIWNLIGGVNNGLHVTDVSNSSRTMFMDLKTLDWDKSTLETLKIRAELKFYPKLSVILRLLEKYQLDGQSQESQLLCLGDQQAAMLGQACRSGEAKCTSGTGAFILLSTSEELIQSTHGAAVQWLRDGLGLIRTASEIGDLAMQVDSTGGVYFLLAFDGLFTPWWRDDACGVCIGITRFMNRFHIARAVRESMCFQVKNLLDSMHKDAGEKGEADLLGNPVVRPADIETTALGAAYAAGLAIGVWTGGNFFFWGKEGKKLPFSVQH
ncbi:hypothetical protein TEA_015394 [Camellia sinensis var. sinensis]|uniref:Carbohydrate kinase FGGY N-terminal domain-containing protein n=1 Tax=Camellia sinensis var. sinensis TaxID=542762 RepID=A0A4S4EEX2_CAMSN|nr:hypothetical protein TEA_015394 [Camellia sinensis var. sinensis]